MLLPKMRLADIQLIAAGVGEQLKVLTNQNIIRAGGDANSRGGIGTQDNVIAAGG